MWLNENLSPKQLTDLESLTREELWQTHFWLSPIIRKNLLEGNDALQARLDCSAFCDDPDMDGQIGMAFWDHLQICQARRKTD